MRSFFLQLFLSFWVAAIGIFVVGALNSPDRSPGTFDFRQASASTSWKLTMLAVTAYHQRGCSGIAELGPDITLVNGAGEAVCSSTLEPETSELIAGLADGKTQSRRPPGKRVADNFVQVREENIDGATWFLVQRARFVERSWWPSILNSAIPVSILVTFLFAYIITRPVRALSKAFRSFSAGDLDVRLPISASNRRGLGGADVSTLMADFNYMAERVKALVEAQKLLVRDISHELRSPLARLRLGLELAREDSPEHMPALDRVEAEADRVNTLIGEMLTLSLMESTKQLPRVETFAISDLFDELIPDMVFEAEARGCAVRYSAPAEEVRLEGQQEMLRRALENIVRNAIRYTPSGETIEVELRRQGAAKTATGERVADTLRITVRDRGPGVPEASLEQIFRPFYRVDMSRQGSTGGFGVGLAIAERAVHLHSGRIEVMNRHGGGFVVEVTLPVQSVGVGSALTEGVPAAMA